LFQKEKLINADAKILSVGGKYYLNTYGKKIKKIE